MTKKGLIKQIANELDIPFAPVREMVQRTLDEITRTLTTEGRIELRSFGVFEVRRRAPRSARNPWTGEKVAVPARNAVASTPGKEMGELVQTLSRGADPHDGSEGSGTNPPAASRPAARRIPTGASWSRCRSNPSACPTSPGRRSGPDPERRGPPMQGR
jgi:nucleoid DNA-binding protein